MKPTTPCTFTKSARAEINAASISFPMYCRLVGCGMPTSNHEDANTVGDRFPQLVRSSWFGGLLLWCARTSCHTKSGCDHNTCANSHPRFQLLRRAALCDGVFT